MIARISDAHSGLQVQSGLQDRKFEIVQEKTEVTLTVFELHLERQVLEAVRDVNKQMNEVSNSFYYRASEQTICPIIHQFDLHTDAYTS